MSWRSQNKKEVFFVPFIMSEWNFSNICGLSQYILYWIHFQNLYTFAYQKTYFINFCCLFLKSPKVLRVLNQFTESSPLSLLKKESLSSVFLVKHSDIFKEPLSGCFQASYGFYFQKWIGHSVKHGKNWEFMEELSFCKNSFCLDIFIK